MANEFLAKIHQEMYFQSEMNYLMLQYHIAESNTEKLKIKKLILSKYPSPFDPKYGGKFEQQLEKESKK